MLAAMLCAGSPLVARPTIELHVSPMVAPAPATLRIRVTVPPHAENRAVAIVADSDAFFRSSEVALQGEKARAMSSSSTAVCHQASMKCAVCWSTLAGRKSLLREAS
jgi:hypothetical protein